MQNHASYHVHQPQSIPYLLLMYLLVKCANLPVQLVKHLQLFVWHVPKLFLFTTTPVSLLALLPCIQSTIIVFLVFLSAYFVRLLIRIIAPSANPTTIYSITHAFLAVHLALILTYYRSNVTTVSQCVRPVSMQLIVLLVLLATISLTGIAIHLAQPHQFSIIVTRDIVLLANLSVLHA